MPLFYLSLWSAFFLRERRFKRKFPGYNFCCVFFFSFPLGLGKKDECIKEGPKRVIFLTLFVSAIGQKEVSWL